MNRTKNGNAILATTGNLDVVAFDAIAKISGVSGGTVVRVLAAIEAIRDYGRPGDSRDLFEVLEMDDVPTAMPDEARAEATRVYSQEVGVRLIENAPRDGRAQALVTILNARRLV